MAHLWFWEWSNGVCGTIIARFSARVSGELWQHLKWVQGEPARANKGFRIFRPNLTLVVASDGQRCWKFIDQLAVNSHQQQQVRVERVVCGGGTGYRVPLLVFAKNVIIRRKHSATARVCRLQSCFSFSDCFWHRGTCRRAERKPCGFRGNPAGMKTDIAGLPINAEMKTQHAVMPLFRASSGT